MFLIFFIYAVFSLGAYFPLPPQSDLEKHVQPFEMWLPFFFFLWIYKALCLDVELGRINGAPD